jgi:hypothetical protein
MNKPQLNSFHCESTNLRSEPNHLISPEQLKGKYMSYRLCSSSYLGTTNESTLIAHPFFPATEFLKKNKFNGDKGGKMGIEK